jgi:hypothetical protein
VTSVEVFRFFRHDEVGTWFGRSADAIQRLLAAEQVLGRLLVGSAAYLLVRIVKR